MFKQVFAAKGKLRLVDILWKIAEEIQFQETHPEEMILQDEQADHGY